MSLTPQLRDKSPAGSQSLFNHPTDVVPSSPPPFNVSAPPTFPTNFTDSLPPPMTNNWASFSSPEATPTNTLTPETSVTASITPPIDQSASLPLTPPIAPPTSDKSDTSSLDKGSRGPSPVMSLKVGSLLPPPPGGPSHRPRLNEGFKSEPTSPMMSMRGLSPPGGRKSPRTSSSSLHDSAHHSLSPLATVRQSVGGGGASDVVVPIAVAFQETCNAIYKGSDLSK